jgi:hypothetical protein
MQTQVALSMTESEYLSLSTALREVIYLQHMIREMQKHGLEFEDTQPKVHCKAFEDNSSALEMANIFTRCGQGPSTSQFPGTTFVITLKMETSLSYLSARTTSLPIA